MPKKEDELDTSYDDTGECTEEISDPDQVSGQEFIPRSFDVLYNVVLKGVPKRKRPPISFCDVYFASGSTPRNPRARITVI